ncbi:MAG: hypothetical protein ABSG68_14345 [Thermoguttaceae bacterium]|jgi:hypothetical protein
MNDFLDQLAELEVRDPPPEFDRQLHQRVNRALVFQQLLGLVFALPGAALHFLRGLLAVAAFSLSGKFDDGRRPDDPGQSGR